MQPRFCLSLVLRHNRRTRYLLLHIIAVIILNNLNINLCLTSRTARPPTIFRVFVHNTQTDGVISIMRGFVQPSRVMYLFDVKYSPHNAHSARDIPARLLFLTVIIGNRSDLRFDGYNVTVAGRWIVICNDYNYWKCYSHLGNGRVSWSDNIIV